MPEKCDVVQLAKDIKENKQGALEKLLDLYGIAMLGFIRSKNLLNDTDSEDIYQDTVIDIWKRIGEYDPGKATFLGYLLGIAQNSIAAYYKSAAREDDGSDNDGYIYEDESGENLLPEDEASLSNDGQASFELLQELKGKPDFFVVNSSYLYEKYILLLKTLMGEVIPEHYALAYAVIKLTSGQAENIKGLEPHDIMDMTLFELLLLFKKEYSNLSAIPDANIDDEIMLMFNKLNEMSGERKLGAMKLGELIPRDEENELSDLNTIVKRKIREFIDGKFIEIFKV